MTVWLLCDDSELRELVVSVAQRVNLPIRQSDADDAKRELQDGARLGGLFATDSVLRDGELQGLLDSVQRVVVASASEPVDLQDRDRATPLRLPTSLARLEAALRWLAFGDGAETYSSTSESSSASA